MKIYSALFVGLISLCATYKSFALPNPKHVYWVILAGGGGTRLWPLSRVDKPKQFLDLTDSSLIQQSVERLKFYPKFKETNTFVSTSQEQAHHVYKIMDQGLKIDGTIEEPNRRDTGPAILLAVMTILKKDPKAHIMFLPSDPYIPYEDYQSFSKALEDVMEGLDKEDKIVLLGKKPDYPATGFGYIEFKRDEKETKLKDIAKFHEKPKLEVASQYLQMDNMLWNMGIFAGKARVFAELFSNYAPKMYRDITNYIDGKVDYIEAEKKSVGFAIMEPASLNNQLKVLPIDSFSWKDVGNIDVFLSIKNEFLQKSGVPKNPSINVKSKNNKALSSKSNKLIAFVGVEGLCVVDTEDTLLVSKCSEAEDVKQVVNRMNENQTIFAPYL